MARGGKRAGAGRKAGAPNKATAERQKAVEETGLTPLEYMLGIMRDENMTAESRFEAAKAAAPYVHPKLAAVEHTGKDGDPIEHAVAHKIDAATVDAALSKLKALG